MNAIPSITVQLIHIQGPMKGEIQEFSDSEIKIGRHPDCQVNFPKDMVALSRLHAKIVREGNRFRLIDQSTNGTYLNGQKISENYLKDGDVLMFSEGGPKISFLMQTCAKTAQPSSTPTAPARIQEPSAVRFSTRSTLEAPPVSPPAAVKVAPPLDRNPIPVVQPVQGQPLQAGPVGTPDNVKTPFAIQYGPALKSFQMLPIVIGKSNGCDFVIPHPAVGERHAQIFFMRDQYWIKDLTGTNSISINGQPISIQSPLQPDMQIALTAQGPRLRFIGGGRLAEIDDPPPEPQVPVHAHPAPDKCMPKPESLGQKAGSLFKKFFA